MSKFKVGDVIERSIEGKTLKRKVLKVGVHEYLLENTYLSVMPIVFVERYYKLKIPSVVVNV